MVKRTRRRNIRYSRKRNSRGKRVSKRRQRVSRRRVSKKTYKHKNMRGGALTSQQMQMQVNKEYLRQIGIDPDLMSEQLLNSLPPKKELIQLSKEKLKALGMKSGHITRIMRDRDPVKPGEAAVAATPEPRVSNQIAIDLDHEWVEVKEAGKRTFYHNKTTKKSQWTHPWHDKIILDRLRTKLITDYEYFKSPEKTIIISFEEPSFENTCLNFLWLSKDKIEKDRLVPVREDIHINQVYAWRTEYPQMKITLWYDSAKEYPQTIENERKILLEKNIQLDDIQSLFDDTDMGESLKAIYNSDIEVIPFYLKIDMMKFIISLNDSKNRKFSIFCDFRVPLIASKDLYNEHTKNCLNNIGLIFSQKGENEWRSDRRLLETTSVGNCSSEGDRLHHSIENSFHIINPLLAPLILFLIEINVYRFNLIRLWKKDNKLFDPYMKECYPDKGEEWLWPPNYVTVNEEFSQVFYFSLTEELIPLVYNKVLNLPVDYEHLCMTYPFITKIHFNGLLEFKSYTFPYSYFYIEPQPHPDVKKYENVKQVVEVNGKPVYELTFPVITQYTETITELCINESTGDKRYEKSTVTVDSPVQEQGITCIWYPIKNMDAAISRGQYTGR
jgi:hypothetical protein